MSGINYEKSHEETLATVLDVCVQILAAIGGSGSSLTAANFVAGETLSPAPNGSNPTFTIANTPTVGKVWVYQNGVLQTAGAGNDYTISGATITFAVNPIVGAVLTASYIKP